MAGEDDAACPRCGGASEPLGEQMVGRYDFSAGAPGILMHVLFFLVVATGAAGFCYFAGYAILAGVMGIIAGILAIIVLVMARRAYHTEARDWRRCRACGWEWSAPA